MQRVIALESISITEVSFVSQQAEGRAYYQAHVQVVMTCRVPWKVENLSIFKMSEEAGS